MSALALLSDQITGHVSCGSGKQKKILCTIRSMLDMD